MVTPVEMVLSSIGVGLAFAPVFAFVPLVERESWRDVVFMFLFPPTLTTLLTLWILLLFYALSFIAGVLQ